MAWQDYLKRKSDIRREGNKFRVSFITELDFIKLPFHLQNQEPFQGYPLLLGKRDFKNVYISGFISAPFSDYLIKLAGKQCIVRIITEHIRRDIVKMHDNGVEVRQNKNIHTRMFIAFNRIEDEINGVLIIGSFDLDAKGLSGSRRDAGIITAHPDLVKSAVEYFELVWGDHYNSKPLD